MSAKIDRGGPFLRLILNLWNHLSRRRKTQLLLILVIMPMAAIAELLSFGALLPLFAFLINPNELFQYGYVERIAGIFHIKKVEQLEAPLLIVFITVVVFVAIFRIGLLWILTKVAFGCGTDLTDKVYKTVLHLPYISHIKTHSSSLITGISGKVAGTANIILHILLLLNAVVLSLFIVGAMLFFYPLVTTISIFLLGVLYFSIGRISKKRLQINSAQISSQSEKITKSIQDGLGAIRNILIDGTQNIFTSQHHEADIALRKAQCSNNIIAASPRYVIEASLIILIAIGGFIFSKQPGGLLGMLPMIGMLLLVVQRLLPNIHQIYVTWAYISGMQASICDALDLLNQAMPNVNENFLQHKLEYKQKLEMKSVCFRYSNNTPMVLENVSLLIPSGSRVGIVGTTGSGKSTLLDILMGLLTPTSGQIKVDGQSIDSREFMRLQKIIAHVPQTVYITDASLAENIAFGVPLHEIDMQQIRCVAQKAKISEFIEGLKEGYATLAGERGSRLSGGQKQRIGIARALYKGAKILMFDEATSALDDATEKSVMDAIGDLGRDITIIFISHRIFTLEICDLIFKIENGHLTEIRNKFFPTNSE